MSEGELKRRLIVSTYPILDAAKKEWLLIEDYRYNKLGQDYISQEEARQAWFKKWFGDFQP
jgi:hypothetical protein